MKKDYSDGYRNVYYQPGEEQVFCYRSGLTVYEETFREGALYAAGWNAAGYPLNVLGSQNTRLKPGDFPDGEAFGLDIGGESCVRDLQFVSFGQWEEEGAHTHAVLTLRRSRPELEIRIHTLLDGTPCFSRWLEITNRGETGLAVSRLAVLGGGIEKMDNDRYGSHIEPEDCYSLGYFDAAWSCTEGDFSWHTLTPDTHSFAGRYARGRHRHPMFLLKNNLRGTMMIGQLAYSAGYRFSFDLDAHPWQRTTGLSFSCEIDSFRPVYVLGAGETLVTPAMHIGMVQGDTDDAVNAMHDHIRRSVLTLPEADGSRCLVGAGMGPEHDMSLETTKQFIDQMAAAGAEIFIIDAGWYCPPGKEGSEWHLRNGDWVYDPERYPNGLKEVLDYARSKGMGLGLWMEAERIGLKSRVFEEHRDWYTVHRDGKSSDGYLDLTNPEALAWCEEEIARVITEYELDLFRVDYNVDSREYFHIAENEGFTECRAIRQAEGFCTLYTRLKKRFPKVIFENCAGGGGRTDLGILYAFQHTWVSDNQVSPRSVLITNGMTMALPPERVDRLVAGMGCHTIGSLGLHMRNAMLTHVSMNVFGQKDCEMNPELFAFISHSLEIYKNFIRPFLPTARVYHHTPDVREAMKEGFVILEDAARDGSAGVIGVFTMPGCPERSRVICPRGLDISRKYRVTFDNLNATVELSGYEMSRNGIRVEVPSALDSELVLYEAL